MVLRPLSGYCRRPVTEDSLSKREPSQSSQFRGMSAVGTVWDKIEEEETSQSVLDAKHKSCSFWGKDFASPGNLAEPGRRVWRIRCDPSWRAGRLNGGGNALPARNCARRADRSTPEITEDHKVVFKDAHFDGRAHIVATVIDGIPCC